MKFSSLVLKSNTFSFSLFLLFSYTINEFDTKTITILFLLLFVCNAPPIRLNHFFFFFFAFYYSYSLIPFSWWIAFKKLLHIFWLQFHACCALTDRLNCMWFMVNKWIVCNSIQNWIKENLLKRILFCLKIKCIFHRNFENSYSWIVDV